MEIPKNDNCKVMANKAEGSFAYARRKRRISDTSCPPQHADISQHMCYMSMYTARTVEVNVSLWAATTTTTTRAPKKQVRNTNRKKLNKQKKIIKLTFVPLGQSRDAGRDEQTEHELPKLKRNVEYDSHRKRA
ncbi:hypothetical protein T10_10153 [Trichinella papuae]|uniref:Uncharacterized protein n=1 Tax=Trichinella papuae TaxID=268474 RepID=A0A0V1MSN8_9BILA|nr:hypothetical protein T10_10153 [Trichinella papuae]